MQIKTTLRFQLTPNRMAEIKTIMEYHSASKNKNIMNFTDKLMDGTRKYNPEIDNPDPKGHAWNVLT